MKLRIPAAAVLLCAALQAQTIGPSVNMVTGVTWPNGDPFLQRQNEPSIAVSSRNPLHLLAGSNDYRTVDLPGVDDPVNRPTGDAWLGVFRSLDGGLTWKSTLVPGYPQQSKNDPTRASSPLALAALEAGADPVVRPGTNGMFYFSGIAFQRKNAGTSMVFVARYIDDNLASSPEPIRYISTTVVRRGDATHFVDKPSFATDLFRARPGVPAGQQPLCRIPGVPASGTSPGLSPQAFPAGRIYSAWTEFVGDDPNPDNRPDAYIMFSYSDDCGATWADARKISGAEKINHGSAIAVDQVSGAVHVVWRVIDVRNPGNASLMHAVSIDSGLSFGGPVKIVDYKPFDQTTTSLPQGFRTRGFPSVAVDGEGILSGRPGTAYVAFATIQPGAVDARIMVARAVPRPAGSNWECVFEGCKVWDAPVMVAPSSPPGHQFMPAMTFANGKLTVAWYDISETNLTYQYSKVPPQPGTGNLPAYNEKPVPRLPELLFGLPIQDPRGIRRYLLDVRIAQTLPAQEKFADPVRVSSYAFGVRAKGSTSIERLEVNPPNFPMFQLGQVPFIGDYIDLGGATFVMDNGQWRFNTRPTDPQNLYVAWTDNRNVVPPADFNWKNYTPIALSGVQSASLYDPTQNPNYCSTAGNTGIRNQDIYSARISDGVLANARSNAKPLDQKLQRAFPVTVYNNDTVPHSYTLRIVPPVPERGSATWVQFDANGASTASGEVRQITLTLPPRSSQSRSVFLSSVVPYATARVEVIEAESKKAPVLVDINADGTFPALPDTSGRVSELFTPDISNPDISNPDISNPDISNPDISNPDISNPDISNPDISNPDISNPDISNRAFRNPDISNPDISNPDISNPALRNLLLANRRIANPDISNPDISNPDISNPDISNPDISNPDISNPDISNPDISNASLSDTTWAVTNRGNTSAAYLIKFIQNQAPPAGVTLQMVATKRYNTPIADKCTLKLFPHYVVVAQGAVVTANDSLKDVSLQTTLKTPTIPVAPGERILVTVRSLDRVEKDPAAARLRYDPSKALTLVPVPDARNSDTGQIAIPLTIVTPRLNPVVAGQPFSQVITADGGKLGPYRWLLSRPPAGISIDSTTGTLSGQVAAAGVYYVWVFVGDNPRDPNPTDTLNSTDRWAARRLVLTVNPAGGGGSIAVTSPARLPDGTVGVSYSYPLTSTSAASPSWTLASGALPPGLALSSAGLISGTPTVANNYSFTVTVTDAGGNTGTAKVSIVVNNTGGGGGGGSISVTSPASLPAGTVGASYLYPLTSSSAASPVWSLSSGTLPPGLSLNATGLISGTPTLDGTYVFNVRVADAGGNTGTAALTIVVNKSGGGGGGGGGISITSPATLPAATVGTAYSYTLTSSSAASPAWSLSSGALPPGLSLNAAGLIAGTPTLDGTYVFNVRVADSGGNTGTAALTIVVNKSGGGGGGGGGISVTSPASLPAATVGTAYSYTLTSSSAASPAWSLSSGTLPPGLSLNAAGLISGTPTLDGTYVFNVRVADSGGNTGTAALTIVVNKSGGGGGGGGGISITSPATLPSATVGTAYSYTLTSSSAASPAWSLSSGTLPPGLSLNATGLISGTPTLDGTYVFNVRVADAGGNTGTAALTIVVNKSGGGGGGGGISITSPATLPSATVGTAYSYTLTSSSAASPAWSLSSGTLPPGLSLNAAGLISGTPTLDGTYVFNVRVADSGGNTGTAALTIVVNKSGGPAQPPPSIAAITNCASYQFGSIAPGEIICLFGSNLGPVGGQVPTGPLTTIPTTLGSVQLLINGVAAPLLYASDTQVNAVVPFEIAGQDTAAIALSVNGQTGNAAISISPVAPGIFTSSANGKGQGAIINQDGTVNRSGNGAPVGSIVAIYATGAGVTTPPTPTGAVVTGAGDLNTVPVQVTIGGQAAVVTYSGNAPGIVAGGVQVNVRVPNLPPGDQPVVLIVNGVGSPAGVTMSVR